MCLLWFLTDFMTSERVKENKKKLQNQTNTIVLKEKRMGGIWQMGGRSLKFGLRFTKGRKIFNFCILFEDFSFYVGLKKTYISRLWCVRLGYLWDENGYYLS